MKTIGEQIAFYRKKKKLTQTELAEACKLSSKRVIYLYEKGLRYPSHSTLEKIAKELDCTVETILKPKKK
mgnify:CR=1 FL=1